MYFLYIAVAQFFNYYYNFLFLKPDVCRILEFKPAMKGYNLHGHIFNLFSTKRNRLRCKVLNGNRLYIIQRCNLAYGWKDNL